MRTSSLSDTAEGRIAEPQHLKQEMHFDFCHVVHSGD